MSDQPLLLTKRDDGVAIISTNDDPLNRMTLAYVDQLEAVVEDIAADDAVRAFVITAEGTTNFSVGMNLKELGAGMRAVGVDAFFDQRINLISRIETMGKPSVATLFGYCLGGGLELLLKGHNLVEVPDSFQLVFHALHEFDKERKHLPFGLRLLQSQAAVRFLPLPLPPRCF